MPKLSLSPRRLPGWEGLERGSRADSLGFLLGEEGRDRGAGIYSSYPASEVSDDRTITKDMNEEHEQKRWESASLLRDQGTQIPELSC